MSIYTKQNGALVQLTPRVKHNGAIKTPLSVWTKKDGALVKVWEKPYNIIIAESASGVCTQNTARRRGAHITVDLTDTRIPTTDAGQVIISCDSNDIIGYPIYSIGTITVTQQSITVERTESLLFYIGKGNVSYVASESAYTGWEYKRFTFYIGNETEKLTVQTANTYQSGAWTTAPM